MASTVSLADQIMDELLDREMTATQLAHELGAGWVDVVAVLVGLQYDGLVEPVRRGVGHYEVPFRLVRTRKAA